MGQIRATADYCINAGRNDERGDGELRRQTTRGRGVRSRMHRGRVAEIVGYDMLNAVVPLPSEILEFQMAASIRQGFRPLRV